MIIFTRLRDGTEFPVDRLNLHSVVRCAAATGAARFSRPNTYTHSHTHFNALAVSETGTNLHCPAVDRLLERMCTLV